MGEVKIFGESLNWGVHLRIVTMDYIQGSKITS
jgi:hypothetical protein